jgi:N-acetylglucosamine-6-phosphate deacetylase
MVPKADGTFMIRPALIRIRDGAIESVAIDPRSTEIPKGTRRIKGVLAPGFVDLQNNGSYGKDVASQPKAAIETLVRRAPEQGVTTVLPTIVSSPPEVSRAVFAATEELRDLPGADIPGVHAEGPFLNPARKGAHRLEHLSPIDLDRLRSMIAGAQGSLRLLTLAPELPGALDAVRLAVENGVVPSAGHTEAGGDQLEQAQASGLQTITHITNAMTKDLSDDLIRAIVDHHDTVAGVIADGLHVAPRILQRLYEELGPQRMMLVTDASAPAGMPDGRYRLGENAVTKIGSKITLEDSDTLAGSALTMDRAVTNAMRMLGIEVEDAVLMATAVPARAAHLSERGEIAAGKRADFVILDRWDHSVRETIVGGVTRFDAHARDYIPGRP